MTDKIKEGNFLVLCICLIFLSSSCTTRYRNALFTSDNDQITDSIKTIHIVNSPEQSANVYRIKPHDVLAIRNLQDISFISTGANSGTAATITSFTVAEDGSLVLPAVGKVTVAGLSRKQAADKIQQLYKETLLKDPIIELSIINLKVTLLGEFGTQGEFLLENENTSLIDILGKAGGFSPRADPKTLKIIRGDRSNPEIIYVNLKNIKSLASPKLMLQNNDILYIEPLGVYNASEKINSASTILQPVLLIINFAFLIYNFTK
ncbi:polysaccharide biosynthesis/export family protein [Daejeonella oryzae]|uniref:polysaccharide biosynthesis/export family protein n=1 Tax=Daejeonella oryzae TaxID=1122943 RepID=UPI00041DE8EA|nr:polysaccharide biosynthesis/export family protein [Daejeonella oryzae]